ncbi:hypothetical protein BD309DRAFT_950097 [Dichomitus squalens]|nr:hypothetical protein BD309DRAFT_950097 [Dichomitus squalens]
MRCQSLQTMPHKHVSGEICDAIIAYVDDPPTLCCCSLVAVTGLQTVDTLFTDPSPPGNPEPMIYSSNVSSIARTCVYGSHPFGKPIYVGPLAIAEPTFLPHLAGHPPPLTSRVSARKALLRQTPTPYRVLARCSLLPYLLSHALALASASLDQGGSVQIEA